MYNHSEFVFSTKVHTRVNAWCIIPNNPIAALHIVHGMMEHSGRYLDFAHWIAGQGIAVYMNDHPGHGRNLEYKPGEPVKGVEVHGHFADRNGWGKSVGIVHKMNESIRNDQPGLPVFILGHSMGSVMVRSYLRKQASEVDGVILSGTMLQPGLLLNAGIRLVDILKALHGPRYRSQLLVSMGYGSYSKYFKPKRTEFDWLCSDPAVVDKYLADPLCGFPCTTGFYSDLFRGIRENLRPPIGNSLEHLPFLIIGGEKDPAGHFGKDPKKIREYYSKYHCKHVELKLWPEGRHEMLNEVNKEEVWEVVAGWITGQLAVG